MNANEGLRLFQICISLESQFSLLVAISGGGWPGSTALMGCHRAQVTGTNGTTVRP